MRMLAWTKCRAGRWGCLVLSALATGACGEAPRSFAEPAGEKAFDVSGEWSGRNALPEALVAPAAAVWNDQIYIVGGYVGSSSGPASRHVIRLDPATVSVETLADLDDRIADAALVVYRDTLLLVGGNRGDRTDISVSDAVRSYDAETDSWHLWANLPDRRFQHTAQVIGDAVYVVGGENLTRPPGDSIVVIRGRSVEYGPPPNGDFSNPIVGSVVGDTVLAMSSLFDSRVFRLSESGWAQSFGSPFEGTATAGVLLGRLHAFDVMPFPDHRVFFRETGEWRTAPPPSIPVERAAVLSFGSSLFLIGGADDQGNATTRVQVFEPSR